jgi:undecaprenyl-diphosphatase
LLRQALIRRLRPLDAVDAIIYIQINGMPHPRVADRFMLAFTNIMNRGDGWLILLLLFALSDRGRAVRAFRGVVPSLWLATSAVEFGLKYFFRRRRPFSSLIQAIIVGKKPGSYSFPSGHSAAAFAGAALLRIYYPERARLFRGIAALTCFSRVYLGAHYPGDVLTGALSGAAFAKAFRYLLRRL